MQNETCLLLSYLKYGESDAILHCFSKEHGFQSYFLKGIYAPKNKKKAYLSPLNLINITLLQRKKSSSMETISRIEKAPVNYDFNDIKSNVILFFISDFLQQILRNESRNDQIYVETEFFLEQLSTGNFNGYIAFIFNILIFQGISPLLENKNFLDPETGNFSEAKTHRYFDERISTIWKNFLTSKNNYKISLDRTTRNEILQSLMLYFQVHLDGFYVPKSLAVIQEIFD